MPVSLADLITRHGLSTPDAQMESAAQHWDWDQLLTLTQQHPDLPPARTLQRLVTHVRTRYFDVRPTKAALWDTKTGYDVLAPRYLEPWLIALLEQGLPVTTPVSGVCRQATAEDRTVSWSGTVPAMAIAMGLPSVLAWLRNHDPEGWLQSPASVQEKPCTLLHLAVRLCRWDLARSLVEHGADPHAPDSQGSLPWEVLGAATEDNQKEVMDTLGMWPRTAEEMGAGWKRRGNKVGLDKKLDQAWRMLMARSIGEGTATAHELLLRDFLDPQRGHLLGERPGRCGTTSPPKSGRAPAS